jgi:hypothetical protein
MFRPERMQFSGMFRRVALLRTDVSEERIATIISVERINELGKPDFFHLDDEGDKFLRNVSYNKSHMASYLKRRNFSKPRRENFNLVRS